MHVKSDDLGRINLPDIPLEQNKQKYERLVVRVDTDKNRIIMYPTYEPPINVITEEEGEAYYNYLKETRPEHWRFVRSLDENNRLVLPKAVRQLFGWTVDTSLAIEIRQNAIIVCAI